MYCLCCGGPVKSFGGAKLSNGKLCQNCTDKLPSLMLKKTTYLQEYEIKNAILKTDDNYNRFSATSSFGDLHIDEMNGLFCIAKSLDENDKPKSGRNVFSIYDLTEVGIVCKSPRAEHNTVLVDVEFKATLNNPRMAISEVIKRSCRCSSVKKADATHLSWDEPHEMQMFKTLFNQMLSGAYERIKQLLCGKTVHAFELEKARAVFMLPQNFTDDELMRSYGLLLQAYGSQSSERGNDEIDLINSYFIFLKSELENNSQ